MRVGGGRSKMRDRNKTKPWRQPHYIERQRKTELTECVRAKTRMKGAHDVQEGNLTTAKQEPKTY